MISKKESNRNLSRDGNHRKREGRHPRDYAMWKFRRFMPMTGALLLGLAAAFLSCEAKSQSSGKDAEQKKSDEDKELQAEIRKLISELGDKQFALREKATARLKEIGVPALEALYAAEESPDYEIKSRASLVSSAIHDAKQLPPRVNGVVFELIADKEWIVPPLGQYTPVHIALKMINTSGSSQRMFVFGDSVRLLFRDSEGKQTWFLENLEQISPRRPEFYFMTLQKGEFFVLEFETNIYFGTDRIPVTCEYNSTDLRPRSRLEKRKYAFSVSYHNDHRMIEGHGPLWVGSAITLAKDIVIN